MRVKIPIFCFRSKSNHFSAVLCPVLPHPGAVVGQLSNALSQKPGCSIMHTKINRQLSTQGYLSIKSINFVYSCFVLFYLFVCLIAFLS